MPGPPTIGEKAVEELAGSPTEGRQGDIITATMVLKCAWADRWVVVESALNDNYGMGFLYPHDSELLAYCKEARIRPPSGAKIAEDAGHFYSDYEHAIIELSFRNVTATDPTDVTYGTDHYATSERLEGMMIGIPLSYKHYKWGVDGDPIKPAEAPVMHVHGLDYTITHHHIASSTMGSTYTKHTTAIGLLGKCNSAAFTAKILPGVTFAQGTLLCKPIVISRNGDYCDITFRFEAKASGWNKFYRGDTQAWDQLYVMADSEVFLPYPEADFSAL